MNEKQLKKLIKLVEDSDIDSLEISSWGRKVKITGKGAASSNGHGEMPVATRPMASPAPAPIPVSQQETAPEPTEDGSQVPVKSPMVGTFYAAPAPDASPYVSLNEKIVVGQVVCIVEAMKLMNEIESEVSGRVVKIMAENAKPVEFGQVLFLVEPDG
jgi:acetyl-CoA carboxylase biotin carboxyl carrier protein